MMFIHFLKHEAICVPFLAVDIDITSQNSWLEISHFGWVIHLHSLRIFHVRQYHVVEVYHYRNANTAARRFWEIILTRATTEDRYRYQKQPRHAPPGSTQGQHVPLY